MTNIDANTPIDKMTIGGNIYEVGNAKEFKTGDWRSEKPIYKSELCKQCGLCFNVCPDDAIPVNKELKREDFDYDAFLLDSPNRLVIDLKDTQISGSPKIGKNKLISDFRIGNQNKISGKRLVFELNNNVNIKKKFTIEPQAGQKNWRLVIDLSTQGLSDPSPKSNSSSTYNGAVKRKKIVVLDPGHGGKDPGAIGRSYRTYEKNITLSMGKELQKQLQAKGFKVYMTRSTDIFIPLRKRVAIARNYHADLFISIHADSALNRNARGLSVYTLSEAGLLICFVTLP